jgi:hypothetical protein
MPLPMSGLSIPWLQSGHSICCTRTQTWYAVSALSPALFLNFSIHPPPPPPPPPSPLYSPSLSPRFSPSTVILPPSSPHCHKAWESSYSSAEKINTYNNVQASSCIYFGVCRLKAKAIICHNNKNGYLSVFISVIIRTDLTSNWKAAQPCPPQPSPAQSLDV